VNRLVIFNSHARKRQEMVTFRLSAFSVKVGGNCEQDPRKVDGNCEQAPHGSARSRVVSVITTPRNYA
jgi:hypothetical protein